MDTKLLELQRNIARRALERQDAMRTIAAPNSDETPYDLVVRTAQQARQKFAPKPLTDPKSTSTEGTQDGAYTRHVAISLFLPNNLPLEVILNVKKILNKANQVLLKVGIVTLRL